MSMNTTKNKLALASGGCFASPDSRLTVQSPKVPHLYPPHRRSAIAGFRTFINLRAVTGGP